MSLCTDEATAAAAHPPTDWAQVVTQVCEANHLCACLNSGFTRQTCVSLNTLRTRYRRLRRAGCLCRCSSARACEKWPTFAALVFSSVFGPFRKIPPSPFASQGKQRRFRPGSFLRFQPTSRAPPPRPRQGTEGGEAQSALVCGGPL